MVELAPERQHAFVVAFRHQAEAGVYVGERVGEKEQGDKQNQREVGQQAERDAAAADQDRQPGADGALEQSPDFRL